MKNAKDYQEIFYLKDEELDKFQSFLDDSQQKEYINSYDQIITKEYHGGLFRFGMVPPHKWNEFDNKFNEICGNQIF